MTAERQTVWLRGSLERRKKKRFGLCVVPEYPACEKVSQSKREGVRTADRERRGMPAFFEGESYEKAISLYVCKRNNI